MAHTLTTANPLARGEAARALGKIKHPSAVRPLILALRDKSIFPDVEEGLLRLCGLSWSSDLSGYVRQADWEEHCKANYPVVLKALLEILGDQETNPELKTRAAICAGYLKDPAARAGLLSALSHEDQNLGSEPAKALVEVGSVDAVIEALSSSNVNVRRAATWAIGLAKDSRAIEPLLNTIKDPDNRVRRNSACALGYLTNPRSTAALIVALNDVDEWVRCDAVRALGRANNPQTTEPLIETLKDSSRSVRVETCEALSDRREPFVVDSLIVALEDGEEAVRKAAAESLCDLDDPRGIQAVRAKGLPVMGRKAIMRKGKDEILAAILSGDLSKLPKRMLGEHETE